MTSDINETDGLFGALFNRLDRTANPVLLRDLRLYGRGRGMIGAYFLTLAILVIAGVTYAVAARWGGMDGARLLYIPTVLLSLIVGALVPNLVGDRFRGELSSRASELALASPLTAGRMVRGKIYGAWILTGVIVSTAAPIFATAYLLGGVTLLDLLGLACGIVLAGLVMPLPQLYLATKARKPGGGRVLAGIVFVGNIALMYGYASLLYYTFADDPSEFLESVVTLGALAAAGVLYGQFLYFVTVSRLRPAAVDRELWPRLSLAFGAVAGGAAAYGAGWLLSKNSFFMRGANETDLLALAALIVSFAFCFGMELISHGNGAEPLRVVDEKRSFITRALFSTGLGSISLYFILCGAAVLACGLVPVFRGGWSSDARQMVPIMLSPFVAYATGLVVYSWVVKPFFGRKGGAASLPTTIVVVNLVVALLAVFGMVIADELEKSIRPIVYGSNFLGLLMGGFERPHRVEPIVVVGIVTLAILFLAQLPIIVKSWRRGDRRDEA